MYSSRRPSNWYEMDYHERQAWERQEQERQDLEYDKQRAQEEAEQAQDEARRLRQRVQFEITDMREDYGYQIDDLNSQIGVLKAVNAQLLKALEDLYHLVSEREQGNDELEPELTKAEDAINKAHTLEAG